MEPLLAFTLSNKTSDARIFMYRGIVRIRTTVSEARFIYLLKKDIYYLHIEAIFNELSSNICRIF